MVPEGLPDLAHGGVDAMLGVEKDILAPEPLDNLLSADYVAILFRQQDKQLHRNPFQFQDSAVAPQLKAGGVEFELAEFVAR